MKNKITLSVFLISFLLSFATWADTITMTLGNTCGIPAAQLEVEIMNPPGGYAQVSGNSVTVNNIAPGQKLSVVQKMSGCMGPMGGYSDGKGGCSRMPVVFGPWTPAAKGGTLSTSCMSR
ncbi:MAG: hypothetical protein Q7T11_00910 [Deltaproteobacteria bacterium]|nr:hypothetical protein [Deltaproteobacteria bacterium]